MRRTVPAVIALLTAAACTGPTPPSTTPSPSPAQTWAAENIEIHSGKGPVFPTALDGWKLEREFDTMVRAFTDRWVSLCGKEVCEPRYPATMNGCADQYFLVRWRSINQVPIRFGWALSNPEVEPLPLEQELSQPAVAGWASLYGCGWPVWQYVEQPNGGTLGDVAVAVQVWVPMA